MADINPETDEVVDDISRTTTMRVAQQEKVAASKRATADVIATLEDKHWRRGWIVGMYAGIPTGIVIYKIYLAIRVWMEF